VRELAWHIAVNKGLPLYGIEVWNEPNVTKFGPVLQPTIGQLCAQAKQGLKDINFSTPVISGGVFTGTTDYWPDWRSYFSGLMQELPPGVEVGLHPYALGDELYSTAQARFDEAQSLAGARPIWITEAGFSSTRTMRDFQCNQTNQNQRGSLLYEYARTRGARAFTWYRVQDVSEAHRSYQVRYVGYGAITVGPNDNDAAKGVAKPIWNSLATSVR
jgi:hypothetical protein